MGEVLTFTPRPKPTAPATPELMAGDTFRASLEEAAKVALDAADRIIAVLDHLDGAPSDAEGDGSGSSQAGAEARPGAHVMRLHSASLELDAPAAAPAAHVSTVIEVEPLRWGGRGNVLAAAGSYLFDLLERA